MSYSFRLKVGDTSAKLIGSWVSLHAADPTKLAAKLVYGIHRSVSIGR
jgi:hypothetical protein